jgi:hypothetical protein
MFRTIRRSQISILILYILSGSGIAINTPGRVLLSEQRPLDAWGIEDQIPLPSSPANSTLPTFLDALDILQQDYFAIWQGIWPSSIDWTSAVIGTYLSSALTTISTSFPNLESEKDGENLINKYFSQLVGSYFGQDSFALRQEAYDDMLWVVLGWLESIKFINAHSALHYDSASGKSWYGKQYIPAFAHRARLFWDMASQGWDTKLCNGGMIWSPYLVPYKNAITNELYIAASITMYLHFPGDQNTSPFGFSSPGLNDVPPAQPHDPKYLAAAIEAYRWLNSSNMTDAKGLYVDGFHVSGWSKECPENSTVPLRCDQRNEMVYTYNQGVLLSGQRGLYEATGAKSYLVDGHKLVSDVIAATGWDLRRNVAPARTSKLGRWHGLGRSGILEEACDAPGYCSQDSQTFKGIFFHHLTFFCSKLPDHPVVPDGTFIGRDFVDDKKWHEASCKRYGKWVEHNAWAALSTKNTEGRFGMWWGAPDRSDDDNLDGGVKIPGDAVDYKNLGVPQQWEMPGKFKVRQTDGGASGDRDWFGPRDLNDRGRGRSVETQGGGVSVLRAAWEIIVRGDE